MQPLIIYTLRPQGFMAQMFAEFLSTDSRKVQLRPLSELPTPVGWEARRRLQLEADRDYLRQAIGGLEMGIALAAAAPHRFPEGPMWAAEKQTHERRLKVVEWKLQQITKSGGQVDG